MKGLPAHPIRHGLGLTATGVLIAGLVVGCTPPGVAHGAVRMTVPGHGVAVSTRTVRAVSTPRR